MQRRSDDARVAHMSEPNVLSDRVATFIDRSIDSVAELEGLLIVRRDPSQSWTGRQLGRRLYITDQSADEVLHALHRAGLMTRAGDGFRYEPASAPLREDVDLLAESYPRFLIAITNAIHAKPRAALREFLAAFRLRDDP